MCTAVRCQLVCNHSLMLVRRDTAVGVSVGSAAGSLVTGLSIMLAFRYMHLPVVEGLPAG